MTDSVTPLFDPEKDGPVWSRDLDHARDRARAVLAEKGRANLHDGDEMIRAAYGLAYVLAGLLDAIDADQARKAR
ncbi:hypothetical protein ACFUJR_14890 [Streptomyces sp. NPDC057271]|uniref:hypothetical protein n=1 Tax=unclassified Streptomyces TaxID=2593676 RepID=UPI0036356F31